MKILGAAYTVHDHSVCLIEEGEVRYHYELERFNRRKHNWIDEKEENRKLVTNDFEQFAYDIIKKEKPDIIAISGMGYPKSNGLILPKKYHIKQIRNFTPRNFLSHNFDGHIYYVDHHVAHAAYSFLTSNFDEADIIAYDGGGERFRTLFIDKDYNFKFSEKNSDPTRLGGLWGQAATYSMGKFAAGKLMGLSAYGKANKRHLDLLKSKTDIFRKEINWDDFDELKDLAASLQYYSIIKTLEILIENQTSKNLCISGGVGLNGYINQSIYESELYDNLHLPPAMGDDGISMGAALHALWMLEGKRPINKNLAYLGKEYTSNIGVEYSYSNLYPFIAQKISEGKVVGWYQGRSESGPRALGNRSILADPRDTNMKDHINRSVKHREWFRPFAPAIMKEHVQDWFLNVAEAKYMLKIAKFKEGMGDKVPAVCHIDYTGRVQTVTREDNEHFYNLIKAFNDLTNIPILLNTSFNDNTEPIVETPEDALNTFQKNDIDILVLGNRVISK